MPLACINVEMTTEPLKGETGSRTRSAARRASTERVRISGPQARPLTHLERPKPQVMGADKEAKRPAGCTLDDRGRLAPFPPGREGRGDGWRARNAPFSRSPAVPAWGRCVGPAPWNRWPFSGFKTDSAYGRPTGRPRKRRRRFLRAWQGLGRPYPEKRSYGLPARSGARSVALRPGLLLF